ncbi:taste receptor type 1 member 1-like [Triplophysa rosa]|uniref:Taste receptor n=1 Tax=Triplophysa rosa TaxID=992332 RepID=A0A9W7T4H2_TRIRA|nr:taste receptor type 1 member 1-like [Triplophysa rosa]KAI7789906.1 taste receptor [Triplophysa rosa]
MLQSRIYTFLVGFTHCVFFKVSCSSSEFSLDGDYLLGGLFPVHEVVQSTVMLSPEGVECKRHPFSKSGYHMFQVMRFAVEEINNSSSLLPNVSLGYEIFDHCSETKNFPSVFNLISEKGLLKPQEKLNSHHPKIIALTGPYGSTRTLTIAPLVTMDLIPWVQYGAASHQLNDKLQYPTFIRAIPSNKDLIPMIIHILQWYGWNWVAFLGGPDNYSEDGLSLFYKYISNTGICLAYQETLHIRGNYNQTLKNINMLNINVIVVFALPIYAETTLKAAIANNVRDKVWIASQTWSMSQQLPREPGIKKIGTVIGITERLLSLPGFDKFIYKLKATTNKDNNSNVLVQGNICNQECKESASLTAKEIINENPTFSFAIYAAIYTIAHALHKVLQCDPDECRKNTTFKPYMLLGEMKKLDFPLSGRTVKYDVNGNPVVNYAVVLWHTETNPPRTEMVGTYDTYPEITFAIDNSLMPWRNNTSVPFSNCSVECREGYSREQEGFHACCFRCKKCPQNTYVDYSRDPYTCYPCAESEWSDEGSTTCKIRSVVYLQFTEITSIVVIFFTACLITLLIFIFCLFAYNSNTPVVRSAGGNMCFLMLASLTMSSISVFFFFGQPTSADCILRDFIFSFFFTICLSCMTVRSFQIVCVFKMAAEFPKLHGLWVKHNGQWLFILFSSFLHFISCVLWATVSPDHPFRDSITFNDQTMLICERRNTLTISIVLFISWFLGFLCISFSYMGRDLPKSYNEAKSITFSLLMYYLSWITYFTIYLTFKSKYVLLLNALAQISSIYGILFSYFIPKSYIMLFQPKKNTAAYFQTSIQNYTQTISRS